MGRRCLRCFCIDYIELNKMRMPKYIITTHVKNLNIEKA